MCIVHEILFYREYYTKPAILSTLNITKNYKYYNILLTSNHNELINNQIFLYESDRS